MLIKGRSRQTQFVWPKISCEERDGRAWRGGCRCGWEKSKTRQKNIMTVIVEAIMGIVHLRFQRTAIGFNGSVLQ
jgi:hypothetical protein